MLLLIKKFRGWSKQQFAWLWESNSGDWPWLAEKPMQIAGLNRSLWRGAVPSISFYVLLSLSGIIATLGLLANSAATIIGAMIVAPLMGPIIAIAYSMNLITSARSFTFCGTCSVLSCNKVLSCSRVIKTLKRAPISQ